MRSIALFLKRPAVRYTLIGVLAAALIGASIYFIYKKPQQSLSQRFNSADYASVIAELTKKVEQNPNDITSVQVLAAAYLQKATIEPYTRNVSANTAIKYLTMAIQVDKHNHETIRLLALAFYTLQNYELAEKNFLEAIRLSKDTNLEAYSGYAQTLEAKGDLSGAVRAYENILKRDVSHDLALLGTARIALKQRDIARALEHADKAFYAADNVMVKAEALQITGASYMSQSRFEAAEIAYKQALDINPNMVGSMVGYGETLFRKYITSPRTVPAEQATEAMLAYALRAIALNPKYIYGYVLAEKIYAIRKDTANQERYKAHILNLIKEGAILTDLEKKNIQSRYDGSTTYTITDVRLASSTDRQVIIKNVQKIK